MQEGRKAKRPRPPGPGRGFLKAFKKLFKDLQEAV
jgi:hypothetical protein